MTDERDFVGERQPLLESIDRFAEQTVHALEIVKEEEIAAPMYLRRISQLMTHEAESTVSAECRVAGNSPSTNVVVELK